MTPDKPKGISKSRFWGQNRRVNRINDLPIFMQQRLMAVAIDTEPELSPAKPVLLFEGPYAQGASLFGFFDTPPYTNYDVAPDGEGFIMIQQEERGGSRAELEVVLNWFEELKRLVPAN